MMIIINHKQNIDKTIHNYLAAMLILRTVDIL